MCEWLLKVSKLGFGEIYDSVLIKVALLSD